MRYWLTPPELESLRVGRTDMTPYPRPVDWDALDELRWPKPWYLNPPFDRATAFVPRAIEEGGPGIVVFPTTTPTALLIEAGARLESIGRPRWLECDSRLPMPNPPRCLKAVLL